MLVETAYRNMEECHQEAAQVVTLLPKIKAYKDNDVDYWCHFLVKQFTKKRKQDKGGLFGKQWATEHTVVLLLSDMRVGKVRLCDAKQKKIKGAHSSRMLGKLQWEYCTENSSF
jgi:hypothetical protein